MWRTAPNDQYFKWIVQLWVQLFLMINLLITLPISRSWSGDSYRSWSTLESSITKMVPKYKNSGWGAWILKEKMISGTSPVKSTMLTSLVAMNRLLGATGGSPNTLVIWQYQKLVISYQLLITNQVSHFSKTIWKIKNSYVTTLMVVKLFLPNVKWWINALAMEVVNQMVNANAILDGRALIVLWKQFFWSTASKQLWRSMDQNISALPKLARPIRY